jgi:hypothetical protein
MYAMTRTLNRLSDRLLGLFVPKTVAAAGCVTDPYDYWGDFCFCYGPNNYFTAKQRCHVYSNCTTTCTCQPRAKNCY